MKLILPIFRDQRALLLRQSDVFDQMGRTVQLREEWRAIFREAVGECFQHA